MHRHHRLLMKKVGIPENAEGITKLAAAQRLLEVIPHDKELDATVLDLVKRDEDHISPFQPLAETLHDLLKKSPELTQQAFNAIELSLQAGEARTQVAAADFLLNLQTLMLGEVNWRAADVPQVGYLGSYSLRFWSKALLGTYFTLTWTVDHPGFGVEAFLLKFSVPYLTFWREDTDDADPSRKGSGFNWVVTDMIWPKDVPDGIGKFLSDWRPALQELKRQGVRSELAVSIDMWSRDDEKFFMFSPDLLHALADAGVSLQIWGQKNP